MSNSYKIMDSVAIAKIVVFNSVTVTIINSSIRYFSNAKGRYYPLSLLARPTRQHLRALHAGLKQAVLSGAQVPLPF